MHSNHERFLPGIAMIGAMTLVVAMLAFAAGSPWAGDFTPLAGNHPDGAASLAAESTAPAYQPLQMEIYLSPRNKAERDQLAQELQDPSSPNYHKFLTPDEYDQRFGPTQADVDQVSNWLTSQGFTVTHASAQERRIAFTGDVATAQNAFLVHIAASSDGKRFSNLEDPQMPAALASKVGYLAGLDNLHGTVWNALIPDPPYNTNGLAGPYFGPLDIRTFADENPLLMASPTKWDGTGECIALSEGSDVDQPSLAQFNTVFGLPQFTGSNYAAVFPDGSPGKPGSMGGGSPYDEAMLDVQYSHGLAPGAKIIVYAANAGTMVADQARALVDTASAIVSDKTNHCHTVAVSWAQCGEPNSFFTNLDSIFQEGAMNGQSIFVATGDLGTAAPAPGNCFVPPVPRKPHIEENAASLNVTAVGASMFQPVYDGSGNDTSTDATTKQQVWKWSRTSNISFLDGSGASTSGVSSVFVFSGPSWQSKVIKGNHRVVPDLVLDGGFLGGTLNVQYPKKGKPKATGKLYAAPGYWECLDSGYVGGNGIEGSPYWTFNGGTSIVPPQYAAVFAILNQKAGASGGQGLINPKLYAMAEANSKHLSKVGILDIVSGNNGLYSVPGYTAHAGFDDASGWGAIDITNFVNAYIGFAFTAAEN